MREVVGGGRMRVKLRVGWFGEYGQVRGLIELNLVFWGGIDPFLGCDDFGVN